MERDQTKAPLSKFFSIPDQWKEIKLKHLLTHSSGLAGEISVDDRFISAIHSSEELLALAKTVPLAHSDGPGKHYLYSNMGFTLLALVIEQVTKVEYPVFAEKVLTEQLGLSQTGSDHDSLITPGMSTGYTRTPMGEGRACCFEILNMIGAGEMRSSALDLSKWVDVLLENRFLSEASRNQLWAPQVQMENDGQLIPGLHYGYGWVIERADGRLRIAHNGSVPGFVSDLSLWPEHKKRVIVLSNIRDHAWNSDKTQLEPLITSSDIRWHIEKVLFPAQL